MSEQSIEIEMRLRDMMSSAMKATTMAAHGSITA